MIINKIEILAGQLYDPADVAAALGLKATTLSVYRSRKGHLPFIRLGRKVLYKGEDILAFIDVSYRQAGPENTERGRKGRAAALERFRRPIQADLDIRCGTHHILRHQLLCLGVEGYPRIAIDAARGFIQ